ncbi:hypothetical protein C5167_047532 [Papaver somniferum]|uniref:Uncharacterized protein n=1 Tax=Papaver somniferum TaxID=3469 RepID=A0A4Y7LJU7_PAPSO|nr:hypothetical protein C5167_047532 [Papaver somniferum]
MVHRYDLRGEYLFYVSSTGIGYGDDLELQFRTYCKK